MKDKKSKYIICILFILVIVCIAFGIKNVFYKDISKLSGIEMNAKINVDGVKLNKTSITLEYGKSEKLTVTVKPSNATNKNVTWTSSDTSLVTVDKSGNIKVVANKNGTATITVKTNSGSYTAKCTVKVTALSVKVSDLKKTSKLSATYINKGKSKKTEVTIKSYIEGLILAKPNFRMQNFSITDNYVYVSSPLNGAWLTDYNSKQYGEILKSKDFENISSVFVTRIEKKNGTSQINEIKYSGHGQGFDVVSKDNSYDVLFLTTIASPYFNGTSVGAFSNGISYTSFKDGGNVRVPGVTIAFAPNPTYISRIESSNYTKDNKFDSTGYFNEIKSYSSNGALGILSMATDGEKIVYSKRTDTSADAYIYKLSDFSDKTFNNINKKPISYKNKDYYSVEYKKIANVGDGQGFEIYGDYFYVVRDFDEENSEKIKINKYYIQDPTQYESLIIDITELYKGRTGIEAEGLSIYGGKLYLGITSKIGSIAYNDIYLLDGFF